MNNVGAHLRDFSLEVLVITDPSRNQLIGALLRLVAHAVLHQARAPVIIGYYGPVNDLMLKLNDGVLDLRLIFDLLLLLPTEEIIIPVIDGFDRDVHISLRNELYTKLDQSRRRFILYHAIRSDGPSIFSHLSKELATSRNLKAIMELIDDLSENVSSALAIEDINLSSMHSKEPGTCMYVILHMSFTKDICNVHVCSYTPITCTCVCVDMHGIAYVTRFGKNLRMGSTRNSRNARF